MNKVQNSTTFIKTFNNKQFTKKPNLETFNKTFIKKPSVTYIKIFNNKLLYETY